MLPLLHVMYQWVIFVALWFNAMHDEPKGIQNSLISRKTKILSGQLQTIYRVDLPQDSQWQFVFQDTGAFLGVGNLEISYRSKIADLTSTISYGRFGGDILTGFGSVEIEALAINNDTEINSFFTTQSKSIDIGSLQINKLHIGAVGTWEPINTKYLGWTPFPYNRFCMMSNSTFSVRFVDSLGATVFSAASTNNEFKLPCVMPPHLFVEVKKTVAVQQYQTVYYREG